MMLRRLGLLLLCLVTCSAQLSAADTSSPGHYLFVWTGDQAKQGNDFLAVFDGDPRSPGYGKLLRTVATDQVSVRIHHTEYVMPESGMLFANDHDANRTFIFNLKDPLHPKVGVIHRPGGVRQAAQLPATAQWPCVGVVPACRRGRAPSGNGDA